MVQSLLTTYYQAAAEGDKKVSVREIEKEVTVLEQVTWKRQELQDFVLDVFDQFVTGFGPQNIRERGQLRDKFASEMMVLALNKDHPAKVEFPNGLTFAFVQYAPEIYRGRFDELINFEGEKIKPPLEDVLFFWVKVGSFSGDRDIFKEVCGFFGELKNGGQPIDMIDTATKIKQKDYYGKVYGYLSRSYFKAGVGRYTTKVFTPRQWVLRRKEVSSEYPLDARFT